MDLYLAANYLLPLQQVGKRSPGMCQLAIHTQNIKFCSNISIPSKEIIVALSLQSQECKYGNWFLGFVLLLCVSCAQEVFFIFPFLLVASVLL
jgi:hypothetical protein